MSRVAMSIHALRAASAASRATLPALWPCRTTQRTCGHFCSAIAPSRAVASGALATRRRLLLRGCLVRRRRLAGARGARRRRLLLGFLGSRTFGSAARGPTRALVDAALQKLHQVDHLRRASLGRFVLELRQHVRLALLDLLLDALHQVFVVRVLELFGVEFPRHVGDELLRELELLRRHADFLERLRREIEFLL